MEAAGYQVELDVFEGPLDLLLHLVKKHELSILDIPISFVTQKYLDYLDAMQALDIDIAGEYLLMAATLCHIKSRELLPHAPEEIEEEVIGPDGEVIEGDPRADLIRRLLEYQKYKEAANQLGESPGARPQRLVPRHGHRGLGERGRRSDRGRRRSPPSRCTSSSRPSIG